MSESFPIPARLNFVIVIGCTLVFFLLFFVGAHLTQWWTKLLSACAFGLTMIPVYSLIHEAAHNTLHTNSAVNKFLGRWLCCLFITSFTFYRHCHFKHHKKNRTDEEMWDLYYEHQSKWQRHGNLYLMMVGFGYLAIWLSVLIFLFFPKLITSTFFKKHTEAKGFVSGFTNDYKLKIAQSESIVVVTFQILLLWLLNWNFSLWITFYLVHGLVWSSQNYVNHAFSPRDIINGAHNLKIPAWLNVLYLNFNVHLAHHQNPNISWIHLKRFVRSEGKISFFRNYISLWRGPRMTEEKSPKEIL